MRVFDFAPTGKTGRFNNAHHFFGEPLSAIILPAWVFMALLFYFERKTYAVR